MIRVTVLFTNFGPYHVARASALSSREDVDAWFIELASAERRYPWQSDKSVLGDRLVTLLREPYEDTDHRELERRLIRALSDQDPDVVVIAGYSEPAMRRAARWAKARGRGVVLASETLRSDRVRKWAVELAKSLWIRRYVNVGFTGGPRHAQYLQELGLARDRIWEGCDVVDNSYFEKQSDAARQERKELRSRLSLPEDYFLYVGRFAAEKNLSSLLFAYQSYRDRAASPWDLVLVGGGPQEAELRMLASSRRITGVQWCGFQHLDTLPAFYGLAKCFVLPSLTEPWGLVVNEAMASGAPVIVSNRCGAADLVVEGQNGFLFDPEDLSALTRALTQVAAMDPETRSRLGRGSRKTIAPVSPEWWASQLSLAASAARVE